MQGTTAARRILLTKLVGKNVPLNLRQKHSREQCVSDRPDVLIGAEAPAHLKRPAVLNRTSNFYTPRRTSGSFKCYATQASMTLRSCASACWLADLRTYVHLAINEGASCQQAGLLQRQFEVHIIVELHIAPLLSQCAWKYIAPAAEKDVHEPGTTYAYWSSAESSRRCTSTPSGKLCRASRHGTGQAALAYVGCDAARLCYIWR